ncbi:MAG: FtsH protease activity modulator HflK [Pseudomonadota bacterium]
MLANLFKRFGLTRAHDGARPLAQEGRRPEGGPPDLDQLWHDFNERIARLFGQKNPQDPGGGRNRGGGDMKGAAVMAGVVFSVVALIWLASGSFIVQEGQTGVVMTFGRYSHMTPAGFNWRWPYPFQSHETVNVQQVRTVEVGYRTSVKNKQPREALMLTDDENIIDIQFAVQYTLKDPKAWLFNNANQDETVHQVAETSIREIVGRSKMDFVLYEGREKVASDVHKLMQQIVDKYTLGALITNVTMQNVQPPEQVQTAFDDALRAVQDRQRAKNEGDAYANNVIPSAKGDAVRLMQDAEAYSAKVTENATGNAARFSQVLAEYQKAPAVTRDRMYIDTMQQIFTSTSKVMIDAKSGSNLLYLPLDKLIAQSGATEPARAAASAPPAVPAQDAVPTVEIRSHDSRSRDSRDVRGDREGR